MPLRRMNESNHSSTGRSNSFSSTDSVGSQGSKGSRGSSRRRNKRRPERGDSQLPPPILVYHESAHSIVFRDHLRRVAEKTSSTINSTNRDDNKTQPPKRQESAASAGSLPEHSTKAPTSPKTTVQNREPHHDTFIEVTTELSHITGLDQGETVMPSQAQIPSAQIANFQPRIQRLEPLSLGPDDQFEHLLQQPPSPSNYDAEMAVLNNTNMSPAEQEVVRLLQSQNASVKTVRNGDWTAFLQRFRTAQPLNGKWATDRSDIGPHDGEEFPFNSFITSTSLLPVSGEKMRCFGSHSQYTVGVVFALPSAYLHPETGQEETEEEACKRTRTWSWPAGCTFIISSLSRAVSKWLVHISLFSLFLLLFIRQIRPRRSSILMAVET